MFTTAASLITTLGKALFENRLEERLNLLTQPKLLIIDEIGYIPIDRQRANLSFQLVSRRDERGSILPTSNQSLGAVGGGLRGLGHRQRDPRSPAPPRDHCQHQRRILSPQREIAQGDTGCR
jgi:hypothetical protein